MSSGKFRKLVLSVIILLLYISYIFAGTTGKIAGRVTEKETGDPLPGVNIIIKGTSLGGTTDLDGNFNLLQVPPGTHSVVVSMVGYASVTINEVVVHIDQTTPLNVELSSEAIEILDIVIVAEKNAVKRDVSTSVTAIPPEEIVTLPVSTITDIVSLQAGVEDGLVVRGGESNELLLQLDGITMRDPRNNEPISSIALSSIQEISLEKGGFNAEYGQVRSGLIKAVTREGELNNYYAALRLKYSPATPKHFGISVYDPNSMWNRPYLDPAVAWRGTDNGAWDTYTQRQYPEFEGWNTISQRLLTDDDPTNDLSPAAAQRVWQWERRRRPPIEPDYDLDASFGGAVPFVSSYLGNLRFFASFWMHREMLLIPLSRPDYKEYNGSLKFNMDLSDETKLMLTGTTGKIYNVVMNADDRQFNDPAWGINGVQFWSPVEYLRTPYKIAEITNEQRPSRIFTESWYSQSEIEHLSIAGKLRSFIDASTYYEINFEHIGREYLAGPMRRRDLNTKYEIAEGIFVDEAPFGFDPNPTTGLTGMFFGGHSSTIRDSTKIYSYTLKADLESQINNENLVKTGVEFAYYDLNLDYGLVNEFFSDVNYVKEKWNPYRFAAFVQDKIEMLGFVAHLGVRMDLSNPNTNWVDVDPFNKDYFSATYEESKQFPTKKSEVDISFSPRLGISHPITENSKLYFSYGHFKQMPAYEEIYRLGRATSGELRNFGDPNLTQALTISYQLGYDHLLFDEYLIQIAAFYNDITNQQTYTQFISDRLGIGYFKATNNSYEDIRGFEVSLRKNSGAWVRGFANFTYQVSTSGAFGKQIINDNRTQQKLLDQNTPLLYQQKPIPQPRANISLTLFTPKDFGPEFLDLSPLGDWSLNILGIWTAGEYITYNPFQVTEVVNNVQVTDFLNFDLRLNKIFDFNSFSVMLFIEVNNLFNSKRLSGASFYDTFDQQFYMSSLHLPESNAYDNIPGDDRVGDYRKEGVPFQPIEQTGVISDIANPSSNVIYYERATRRYLSFNDGNWSEVDRGKMDQILEDKSYIDMPNNSSFDFLNPRQVFFGLNFSFRF